MLPGQIKNGNTMKSLRNLFALAVLISGLGLAPLHAGNLSEEAKIDDSLKVSFISQNRYQMIISFENSGPDAQLNLLKENGKTIHSEAISGNGVFTKRYNFSELDKGIYSIEVKNENGSYLKTLYLK